jgi:general secretion pathway protein J
LIVAPRSASHATPKKKMPAIPQSRLCVRERAGVRGIHTAPGQINRRRVAPSRGFTLIELLVAISIMSMLALLSWRSLDGMTRTQAQTQQRADELLRLQAALGQWAADLDAVVETGEVTAIAFNGQVLRLTRRDSSEAGLQSPGVRVVAWARHTAAQRPSQATATQSSPNNTGADSGQWVRWQSPPLVRRDELAHAWQRAAEWGSGNTNTNTNTNDSAIALVAIDQWQLYLHRGETWVNPLSSVGTVATDTTTTTTTPGGQTAGSPPATELPNGVRLVLTLAAGQRVSGQLVRDWVLPHLQAGQP